MYAIDLPVFDNLYEQTADFTKIQTSDLSQKGRFGATSSGNATRVQSQYEYRYCAGTPTRNTKPPGALELGCPSLLPNGQTLGQGIRILYELPSTIAPHCPGHHSTGFPAIPDKILSILIFFTSKPSLLSRIIRCARRILWILVIWDSEVRLWWGILAPGANLS